MVALSESGAIAAACWQAIPGHFPHVELDAWVVMPNHMHGILWILADALPDETARAEPGRAPAPPRLAVKTGSLGAIVRSYKGAVTRQANLMNGTPGAKLWQRGYYDHIVRTDRALDRIREYIMCNPVLWAMDVENPSTVGADIGAYYRSLWRV
jgi:REP element-mobilizing transposase RayT